MKLFKRLFNIDIHNSVTIYFSMPNSKGTDPLKFRLFLTQGLIQKPRSAVPCPIYGHPSTELPPKRLTECQFPRGNSHHRKEE
jgi:hypothetical protein